MNYNEMILTEIAKMYYQQGLSQKIIAAELGLSRPTVSRMMRQIRDLQIVEVTIRQFEAKASDFLELAGRVSLKLKLKEVFLVPHSPNSGLIRKNMGKIGAEWLNTNIKKKLFLACPGGAMSLP
ncbi:hypothetical protein AGMMS49942_07980 [Spirochaetia bacterium]|nr:hypothetical protein AGMMS49942_07980 [Spirochaetia bacterium]